MRVPIIPCILGVYWEESELIRVRAVVAVATYFHLAYVAHAYSGYTRRLPEFLSVHFRSIHTEGEWPTWVRRISLPLDIHEHMVAVPKVRTGEASLSSRY